VSVPSSRAEATDATPGLRRTAQAVYLLHVLSLVLGLLSDEVVVTRWVVALPSLLAIGVNYARRDAVRGTVLERHFSWQIRTFWIAVAALGAATLLLGPLLFFGLPLLWMAYGVIGLWVLYRVARGGFALQRARPLPS